MRDLHERRVVLGVSGSIAAYKAVYLLRLLTRAGATVTPVLTQGAQRFVGALSFSALAGRRAITDLWSAAESGEVGHVETAHWAELVVIAPASADTIARIAMGRADDPLGAIALATRAPLVVAPAMEDNMWHSEATQLHVDTLRSRGARFVEPAAGALASGREGAGRLAEPEHVLAACIAGLTPQSLAGRRFVVTAGPTREHLDPVRFLSNPSSGRMGFALAEEAVLRGARVTLVTGPVSLPTPWGVERVDVTSTDEMLDAVRGALVDADALIMAAAPADLRPTDVLEHKLKKGDAPGTLPLARTPDILSTLDPRGQGKLVIGFAAETEKLERHARAKLDAKNLDAVVGNLVAPVGRGFATETNEGTLFVRNGDDLHLAMGTKREMAAKIVEWAASRLTPD